MHFASTKNIEEFPVDVMTMAERFEATVRVRGRVESYVCDYGMETADDYAEMWATLDAGEDPQKTATFDAALQGCPGYDEEHLAVLDDQPYFQSEDADGIYAMDKFVAEMRERFPNNKISYNRDPKAKA